MGLSLTTFDETASTPSLSSRPASSPKLADVEDETPSFLNPDGPDAVVHLHKKYPQGPSSLGGRNVGQAENFPGITTTITIPPLLGLYLGTGKTTLYR